MQGGRNVCFIIVMRSKELLEGNHRYDRVVREFREKSQ